VIRVRNIRTGTPVPSPLRDVPRVTVVFGVVCAWRRGGRQTCDGGDDRDPKTDGDDDQYRQEPPIPPKTGQQCAIMRITYS
jgi:hypothetical protein